MLLEQEILTFRKFQSLFATFMTSDTLRASSEFLGPSMKMKISVSEAPEFNSSEFRHWLRCAGRLYAKIATGANRFWNVDCSAMWARIQASLSNLLIRGSDGRDFDCLHPL